MEKANVTFKATTGISSPIKFPEYLGSADYAFKPSMQQDYSLNIQGGSKTTKYFLLVGYMNQNGNYQHTNDGPNNTNAVFKRYNFRSNIVFYFREPPSVVFN